MTSAPLAFSATSRRRVLVGVTGLAAVGAFEILSLVYTSAAVHRSVLNVGHQMVVTAADRH